MIVEMLKNATWGIHPAQGPIEDFKKGQIVGEDYPLAFRVKLFNSGHAKIVEEKLSGDGFDSMGVDELKEKMALAGQEYKGKKAAIKFLKGE